MRCGRPRGRLNRNAVLAGCGWVGNNKVTDPGPQVQNGDGTNDDVFVITKGGLGNVRIASATEVTNNIIMFTFARPVCPARGSTPGDSTFFFGLSGSEVATNAPVTLRDRLGGVHVVNAAVSP